MSASRTDPKPYQRHVWRAPGPRARRRRRLARLAVSCLKVLVLLLAGRMLSPAVSFALAALPAATLAEPPLVHAQPSDRQLLRVEYLGQGEFPTGCESVTAVMALRHAGYDITVEEFIDFYLPRGDFWVEDGQAYGDDPYQCFVGDPYSDSGFGCFAPALARALEGVAGEGAVEDLTGTSLADLCQDCIDQGVPVILWATMDMREPTDGRRWILADSGETFTWPAGEHCLLLVGYDQTSYYFNDPYEDKGLVAYDRQLVETRYQQIGSQALALTG